MNDQNEEYWENLDGLSHEIREEAGKLKVSALLSFLYTSDIINAYIRKYLKENRIPVNQDEINLLNQLVLNHGTMNQTELSRKILRSKYAVSRIIYRLDRQAYITKAPPGIDHRKKEITITKKGLELVKNIATEGRSYVSAEIFSLLGQEEIILLKGILKKIRKHLLASTS
jgi:DNA-binding MarR family transcriptional regulator